MNRYKTGGPSKATPTTLCQKCLQRGHYSYECTRAQQDRPYVSRPSRTQQLINPKLAPKIAEPTPAVDSARLQKVSAESSESRKRSAEENEPVSRKRSRSASVSSSGSGSVSTISTNLSRTPSPHRRTRYSSRDANERISKAEVGDKRRRRSSNISRSENDDGCRKYRQRDRLRHELSRRSRSTSVDRSRHKRERSRRRADSRSRSPEADHFERQPHRPRSEHSEYSRRRTDMTTGDVRNMRGNADRRESGHDHRSRGRSLSPYSKRVALTTVLDESQ